MRAGPTVQVLTGSVGVGARVSSHRAGRMIADRLDVWDVQIEATADRAPRERLTLTAAPSLVPTGPGDPLAHYGQRLHVSQTLTIGGVEALVPIGWYQVETWEEQSDGTVKVEAYDLLQRLEKNPMAWPSSPPYGATVQSELQRLAASPEEGGVPVVLDAPDAAVSREHEWGTSRVEAVGKLCEAHGLLWAVRSDGRLHAWAPGAPVSAAEYTGRDLLIESSRASGARRANRWIVGATGEGEDRESRYTAETTGYEYPYDPAGYGVVTDRNEMQIADETFILSFLLPGKISYYDGLACSMSFGFSGTAIYRFRNNDVPDGRRSYIRQTWVQTCSVEHSPSPWATDDEYRAAFLAALAAL